MKRTLLLFVLASVLAGCGPAHISSYEPKRRVYELPGSGEDPRRIGAPGSVWRGGGAAAMLFSDFRAFREHDLLVVEIEEKADAQRATETEVSRESETQAAVDAFLGMLERLRDAGIDPSLAGQVQTSFRAQGATGRSESLKATVPAVVRQVLPNGNLFIEGHRIILVNDEEQHFYISGVVRPIDVDQDNSIPSTRIAEAEIEFTGRGVLSDNQRQGWLSRFVGWVWPF